MLMSCCNCDALMPTSSHVTKLVMGFHPAVLKVRARITDPPGVGVVVTMTLNAFVPKGMWNTIIAGPTYISSVCDAVVLRRLPANRSLRCQ